MIAYGIHKRVQTLDLDQDKAFFLPPLLLFLLVDWKKKTCFYRIE